MSEMVRRIKIVLPTRITLRAGLTMLTSQIAAIAAADSAVASYRTLRPQGGTRDSGGKSNAKCLRNRFKASMPGMLRKKINI
jgi:hypothetical protein